VLFHIVKAINDAITVYKNPNLKAKKTGTLKKGETIEAVHRSGIKTSVGKETDYWYLIKNKSIEGWVFGSNIQMKEDKKAVVKASSVTATTFIDWKGMYEPKVVFDGNLKTGWLEKSDGPGIGQGITLQMEEPITVDEIKVAPGYFDPKYRANNNRVKKLRIDYGGKAFALEFKDTQTMQKITLPEEITFSTITFTIMEVYPSNKDDDTGISEIEFYDKGEKVEIDMSGIN